MSTPKSSAIPGLVVVELLGPLLEGTDRVAAALGEALAGEGIELRPGALEQAQGMAVRPALERLLEGHGRHELMDEAERIESRVLGRLGAWQGAAPRAAEDALEGWRRLERSESRIAVLTILPADLSARLAGAAGIEVESWQWIHAGDARGLPHPDRLLEWFEGRVEPARVAALVGSTAAALAATAAGCGEVIAVGNGGAAMLAERQVATIND